MRTRLAPLAFVCLLLPACSQLKIDIPDYQDPGEVVHLDQGWSEQEWHEFHHLAQGTRLMRYSWFLALEQPCLSPFGCDPLVDPKYMARFGFLDSPRDPELNPDGLPVGFAKQAKFTDPASGETYPAVGITCAACHTGELRHNGKAVRIEGGPALMEMGQFQKAIGVSMVLTQKYPFRFGRFAKRVLGPDASDDEQAALRKQFDDSLAAGMAESKEADERKTYEHNAGFARTDALARIGNQVFAVDMQQYDNFSPATAPVRYPQIWDSSWFTWVQYNSSISDPLVRNIGEALGVRAQAVLYGPDAVAMKNSVDIPNLRRIEFLLSGDAPYQGLTSPKWPEAFPKLDREKVAQGEQLYRQNCMKCHLPPVNELKADLAAEQPIYWWENSLGTRLLRVSDLPIEFVGTDPNQATDFTNRKSDTGVLGRGDLSAANGLEFVTQTIALNFFEQQGIPPEERPQWNGRRDPNDPAVRDDLYYKARPLNGIWAAAPYLHNGSVPSIYLLLGPQEERPDKFWLGNRAYDPEHVGYDYSEFKGGYLFDVTLAGNGNDGHRFEDKPSGNGTIGRALSHDERMAILEFLKSQ